MRIRASNTRRCAGFALAWLLIAVVNAHAQTLYWIDTNYSSPQLGRIAIGGSNVATISLPIASLPEGLALDAVASKVYWAESAWSGAHVMRVDAGLAGGATLVSGGSSLHGIALDVAHSMMYWTASNLTVGGQLWSAHLDGTLATPIINLGSSSDPRGVAVDPVGGHVYFTDYDQAFIYFCNLNGTGLTAIPATTGLWGIAYSASTANVIVTDYVAGQIRRYPPAGGATTLVTGLSNPNYLALDATNGKIYWSEAGTVPQKVKRANLDGTRVYGPSGPRRAVREFYRISSGHLDDQRSHPGKNSRNETDAHQRGIGPGSHPRRRGLSRCVGRDTRYHHSRSRRVRLLRHHSGRGACER